jgi:aryl-alcohol dehydrogenase-like predicted oxidoreductase
VLARGDDVVPIPGTTKAARIDENAGALFVSLGAADLAQLADAMPPEAIAGDRYPTGMQAFVDQ